ncbi:paraquat-inducible protein A [Litorivivens sp.]|uniref:paraquat-inducible protein A n=1 Tax=Litorivivens sp. TaxID=2020868 RepID=UPI0035689365
MQNQPRADDKEGHCPRCNALLWGVGKHSSDIVLCAALSGLILFIPAITLPILKLTMVGQKGSNSLLGGIGRLWTEGEQMLALLVLLCSIVAPLLHLLCVFAISLWQRQRRFPSNFPQWMKWHRWMQGWSMLEVYAMGIIVAYVKMIDDGEVVIGSGSWCFALLLLTVIVCNQYFREEQAWQQWEQESSA